jgi:hypothetical protein
MTDLTEDQRAWIRAQADEAAEEAIEDVAQDGYPHERDGYDEMFPVDDNGEVASAANEYWRDYLNDEYWPKVRADERERCRAELRAKVEEHLGADWSPGIEAFVEWAKEAFGGD